MGILIKETGILYTPENIDLVDRGIKTQTRRIVKQKLRYAQCDYYPDYCDENRVSKATYHFNGSYRRYFPEEIGQFCPYGGPGDFIYTKEAHYLYGLWYADGVTKTGRMKMRFDRLWNEVKFLDSPPDEEPIYTGHEHKIGWYKRSPLFMEKKDARQWTAIAKIRVERLQDISPSDCRAEGSPEFSGLPVYYARGELSYVDWYRHLWESINGPGSWNENPWVWVIEFKKACLVEGNVSIKLGG